MIILHNIGSFQNPNYTSREKIINCKEPLSFDGIYHNVWENRDILKGKDVLLFVCGNYVGAYNSFDRHNDVYPERFADWNEIMSLVCQGAKLGWHTWSHTDLRKLSDEELKREVTPPFPMDTFAYPYGYFDQRVIKAVKDAGFKEAFVVFDGDNSQYQRVRRMI